MSAPQPASRSVARRLERTTGTEEVVTPPRYLCVEPDDCQGHYRRCTHGTGGPYTLACPPCVKQRNTEGPDYCRTDEDEGLPFPLDTYRSAP